MTAEREEGERGETGLLSRTDQVFTKVNVELHGLVHLTDHNITHVIYSNDALVKLI